jgi:hypothetical protein
VRQNYQKIAKTILKKYLQFIKYVKSHSGPLAAPVANGWKLRVGAGMGILIPDR